MSTRPELSSPAYSFSTELPALAAMPFTAPRSGDGENLIYSAHNFAHTTGVHGLYFE